MALVLIVEEDNRIGGPVQSILDGVGGHTVATASAPEDALRWLTAESRPDVVIVRLDGRAMREQGLGLLHVAAVGGATSLAVADTPSTETSSSPRAVSLSSSVGSRSTRSSNRCCNS